MRQTMTGEKPFRVCHLRDTSNIEVDSLEMGEWSEEPVVTGFPTGSGPNGAACPLGRTPGGFHGPVEVRVLSPTPAPMSYHGTECHPVRHRKPQAPDNRQGVTSAIPIAASALSGFERRLRERRISVVETPLV